MLTAFFTFVLISLVLLIMSVGVIFGRKPVQGSCGGLNSITGMDECEICGGDLKKCEQDDDARRFVDATKVAARK